MSGKWGVTSAALFSNTKLILRLQINQVLFILVQHDTLTERGRGRGYVEYQFTTMVGSWLYCCNGNFKISCFILLMHIV